MGSRFEILDASIPGLKILRRLPIADSRGYLERMFCLQDLRSFVPAAGIAQINRTLTRLRGTVRGLHFQFPPYAEAKFVTCLRGEVFDVAVDLRPGASFLNWHSEMLRGHEHTTFFIPEGFAHGFQTMTDDCEMLYFHTAPWRAGAEGGLNATDPALAIEWPAEITERSPRDAAHPLLTSDFPGVVL